MPLRLVRLRQHRVFFPRHVIRTVCTDMRVRVTEEKDLVIIGGGVAGYVAAIKAGQEGMKVGEHCRH